MSRRSHPQFVSVDGLYTAAALAHLVATAPPPANDTVDDLVAARAASVLRRAGK